MTQKPMFKYKAVAVCLIFVIGNALVACDKRDKKKEEKGSQTTQKLLNVLSKPDQEAVALLSQKYELQPNLVEKFLDIYLTDTDIQYRILKESQKTPDNKSKDYAKDLLALEKESYLKALSEACQATGIANKTGALLATDYKILTIPARSSE